MPAESRDASELKADVLALTLRLMAELGSTRFRMEDIAGKAKVSTATLYRYWPTKGALVVAAFNLHHQRVFAAIEELKQARLAPLEALLMQLAGGLEGLSQPGAIGLSRAHIEAAAADPPESISATRAIHDVPFFVCAEQVARCQDAGHIRPGQPECIAKLLLGAVTETAIYRNLILPLHTIDRAEAWAKAKRLVTPLLTEAGVAAAALYPRPSSASAEKA